MTVKGVAVHVDGDIAVLEVLDERHRTGLVDALLAAVSSPREVAVVTHLGSAAYRVPAEVAVAVTAVPTRKPPARKPSVKDE